LIWLQKGLIIVVGIVAFFLAWKMQSVLESAYFAYTIYGVAITPALLAALASKKVTRTAGLVSIVSGTVITLFLKLSGSIWPSIIRPAGDPNGDPFGIPILYPALAVSVLSLLIVSMLTRKPSAETLKKFFPDKG
jgi:Na+/proline symporter